MKCQAILICKATSKDKRVGGPCNAPADERRQNRHVCWLHKNAQRPIQFDDMATEQSEAAE